MASNVDYSWLGIGIVIAVLIIYLLNKWHPNNRPRIYAVLLATFPVYYWLFALYKLDYKAFLLELGAGLVFILIAYFYLKFRYIKFLYILSAGYLIHGLYDIFHYLLFVSPGIPSWWPEFCGAVDLILGVYLVVYAVLLPGSFATQKNS